MEKTVVIIGTLDTKGPEIAYLRDRLKAMDLQTIVVDSGIIGEPIDIVPDIDHAEVATYGGTTIEALQNAGSGEVVQLAEGLFYLHQSIIRWDFNGILKGSGIKVKYLYILNDWFKNKQRIDDK